jgi:predicted nuclease of predicted toxin-antitoxin system
VNFPLDHDIPEDLARVLLREGHQVARVAEVIGRTAPDSAVFAHARSQGMILVTCNRDDFLKFVADLPHAVIIILIRRRSRTAECAKLLVLLAKAGDQGLANNFNFA